MKAALPVLVAFSFLTRLPLGGPMLEPERLGQAVALFPAVGLALGAVLALSKALLSAFMSPELTAFVLLVLWTLVTGALHLDGVADLCDGLGGARGDRERALGILRDSRIGAFGATGLALTLLGKWLSLVSVVELGFGWPVVLAPTVARWLAVCLLFGFPSARSEGLSRTMSSATRPAHVALATVIALAVCAVAGARAWIALGAAASTALAVAALAQRRLGGLTGDVVGCAVEWSEVSCLICSTITS